ncbi:MAG: hypothetical protein WC810_27875, partial [Janthinobacterium sp.]
MKAFYIKEDYVQAVILENQPKITQKAQISFSVIVIPTGLDARLCLDPRCAGMLLVYTEGRLSQTLQCVRCSTFYAHIDTANERLKIYQHD